MLSRTFSLLGLISSLWHPTPSILSSRPPALALQRLTIDEAHCQFRIIGLGSPVCQFERANGLVEAPRQSQPPEAPSLYVSDRLAWTFVL